MKPILFNTEMVRAILDGRKTCTRRVVKPHYREDEGGFQVCTNKKTGERWVEKCDWDEGSFDSPRYIKPPYRPGDILYVRECWSMAADILRETPGPVYRADFTGPELDELKSKHFRWKPSIHMPKEAARLFLRVTDVRVERLQEITWQQAACEGCTGIISSDQPDPLFNLTPIRWNFMKLWNSTIKKADLPLYGWNANPWVWVIEFDRISKEEAEHGTTDF